MQLGCVQHSKIPGNTHVDVVQMPSAVLIQFMATLNILEEGVLKTCKKVLVADKRRESHIEKEEQNPSAGDGPQRAQDFFPAHTV